MAKYSIPEGADPLGIGVPNLRPISTWGGPAESIRHYVDVYRQERMQHEQMAQQDYQQFVKNLPTVEAVNQKVAAHLNTKSMELGKMAYNQYKAGDLSPFMFTSEGEPYSAALNKGRAELINEAAVYNEMLEKYRQQLEFMNDPDNYDKIDWELTLPRFQAFTEAPDLVEMNKAMRKPLTVLKPDEVDFNKYLDGMIDMYLPGEDKEALKKIFDPTMNKWKVGEVTWKDPDRVERGMKKIYDNMEDKYKNELHRRYKAAPDEQKKTKAGLEISEKDWFITQYSPEYGKKLDVQFVAESKDKKYDWGWLPGKGENGLIDLKDYEELRPLGKKIGEETVEENYQSAATLPLQSVSRKAFVMPNTVNTTNTETGEKAPAGRSTMNIMDNVAIFPVAIETFTIKMPDGSEKTIPAGEKIPNDVQKEMARQEMGGKMRWEAFLTTLTSNKQVPTELEYEGIPLGTKISSFTETSMRPWNESLQYVKAAAQEEDKDLNPLINKVDEILNQLNSRYNEIFEVIKNKNEEDQYEKIFE